jgi:DNA polymerase-4
MDAFYASVEQRDHPELRGRPLIVGGHARRGVVLAASYEVRRFGVRSAMPMARALRLAPEAVVVPPRHGAYAAESERVFDILHQVTPLVEPLSLDEAFLDVTASARLFGAAGEIAARLRRRVAEERGLPASAGIAAVKFIAKIASDLAKPNGQREVAAADGPAFLAPLPVSRLWGVGPKTEHRLRALGVGTIGDLAALDDGFVERRLGTAGRELQTLARGIDPRPVVPDREAKSIGAEETFDQDLPADGEPLRAHVHAQALRVAHRMRRAGVSARTVQLKIKHDDFSLATRRETLEAATDDGQTIYRVAIALLDRDPPRRPVRLTGVSAQNLVASAAPQTPLFAAPETPSQKLNRALDRITARFGHGAVTTADIADAEDGGTDQD